MNSPHLMLVSHCMHHELRRVVTSLLVRGYSCQCRCNAVHRYGKVSGLVRVLYTHHREVSARGLRLLVLSHCHSKAVTCRHLLPEMSTAARNISKQRGLRIKVQHRCAGTGVQHPLFPHCGITSLRQVSTMRLHCSSVSCPSPHAHCSPHTHTHSLTHRETRANTSRLQTALGFLPSASQACFPSHSEFRDPRGLLSSEATLNVNCSPLSLPVEARPLQNATAVGWCAAVQQRRVIPDAAGLHWICPAHSGWCSNLP